MKNALQIGRWVGVVASTWVETTAGNGYAFGLYSPTLKDFLGFNQAQLNTIGFAKDLGDNIGLLAGIAANIMPVWGLLAIGVLQSFVGYFGLWLVLSHRIVPLAYWQMCALLAVGANSSRWLDTASLVTCLRNFPHRRGTVAGILKCNYGLSSAIFTLLHNALFSNDPASFLLLLATGPLIVCLFAVSFVRPIPPTGLVEDIRLKSSFVWIHANLIAFTLYLLAATLLVGLGVLNSLATQVFAGGMLLFLAAPLGIPLLCSESGVSKGQGNAAEQGAPSVSNYERDPLLICTEEMDGSPPQQALRENRICHNNSNNKFQGNQPTVSETPKPELQNGLATLVDLDRREGFADQPQDVTLMEAMLRADFWLLFFSFFCGVGTGIMAINNLGQIGQAQGYTDAAIFVSLTSIGNSFGRLGAGAISDHYIRLAATPRPIWMAWAQAGLVVVHILFATAIPGSLYVASLSLGVCFGMQWSIMVATSSELFGLKHLGLLFNTFNLAMPLGSLFFSGIIAGPLYDRESAKDVDFQGFRVMNALQEEDPKCLGAHCFRDTFIIMAGVCFVGVFVNIILVARIRGLYQQLYGSQVLSRATNSQCGSPLSTDAR